VVAVLALEFSSGLVWQSSSRMFASQS
jgi:hypothetical protein